MNNAFILVNPKKSNFRIKIILDYIHLFLLTIDMVLRDYFIVFCNLVAGVNLAWAGVYLFSIPPSVAMVLTNKEVSPGTFLGLTNHSFFHLNFQPHGLIISAIVILVWIITICRAWVWMRDSKTYKRLMEKFGWESSTRRYR